MPQHTSRISQITVEHLSSAEWQVIQIAHYSELPGTAFIYSQYRTDANTLLSIPNSRYGYRTCGEGASLVYYIPAFLIHHFTTAVGCQHALQRGFMGYYTASLNFISVSTCSLANCIQCHKYCLTS